MRIRSYAHGDLEVCRALWAEMVQRHRDIYDDRSISGDDPGLEFDAHLDRVGPERIWVAETEGVVVGFTSLIMKDHEAEIEPIVVSRKHRGKGTGERLVEHAVEQAKKHGVPYVCVKPVARNKEAISFFHECGFRTIGHIQLFIWLGDPAQPEWKDGLDAFGKRFRY